LLLNFKASQLYNVRRFTNSWAGAFTLCPVCVATWVSISTLYRSLYVTKIIVRQMYQCSIYYIYRECKKNEYEWVNVMRILHLFIERMHMFLFSRIVSTPGAHGRNIWLLKIMAKPNIISECSEDGSKLLPERQDSDHLESRRSSKM
jgi:hypothetical protein